MFTTFDGRDFHMYYQEYTCTAAFVSKEEPLKQIVYGKYNNGNCLEIKKEDVPEYILTIFNQMADNKKVWCPDYEFFNNSNWD